MELYSKKEAILKLGIPQSTFEYKVRHGDIPSVPHPLSIRKRQYPKEPIDRMAAQMQEYNERYRRVS